MSDKESSRTTTLLSILYIPIVLGLKICVYELGRHWHYPVLSLCFSSGISAVFFSVLWGIAGRTARPRITAQLTSRSPSTQSESTPIAWKWEFPAPNTAVQQQPADNALKVNMSNVLYNSLPTFPSDNKRSNRVTKWEKHKHLLACGVLLASGGICSLFSTPLVSYQWQIFAFEFTLPFTFFMSEYTLQKSTIWEKRGILVMICGGFLNGIPIVLSSSFNAWCGMFAATSIIAASLNVYQGYLYQQHYQVLETVAWSNIYSFLVTLLIAPLYAFAGIQQDVHSFSDLFRNQKQGIICLQNAAAPCHPYAWAYASAYVSLFVIYCYLQTKLNFVETPNYQSSINSFALPCMALGFQIVHSAHVEMIYPILAIVVLVVGLLVCKTQSLTNNNLFNKATRF